MMLRLPDKLRPIGNLKVDLPSSRQIELPCCRPQFEKWTGAPIKFEFGHKPILSYQGGPIFSELLILRLLEMFGWEGVWVSSYGGIKYLREMPEDASLAQGRVPLPDNRERLLNQIWRRLRQRGGCFDVYAWRDSEMLFCEAKRQGKVRIRLSQRKWIEAAINEGVGIGSFLVVEWSFQ